MNEWVKCKFLKRKRHLPSGSRDLAWFLSTSTAISLQAPGLGTLPLNRSLWAQNCLPISPSASYGAVCFPRAPCLCALLYAYCGPQVPSSGSGMDPTPASTGRARAPSTSSVALSVEFCCCYCLAAKLCPTVLQPHGLQPVRFLCPWDFPRKNTEVGCHFLLQGIFSTPGLNPNFLH